MTHPTRALSPSRWRAPRRPLAAAATFLALASGLALAAPQGNLAPPRGSLGPGTGDAASGGPGDPAGSGIVNTASWTTWWAFNREAFLLDFRAPDAPAIGPAALGAKPTTTNPSRPPEQWIHLEVVPPLRALLARSKDLDIQAACLLALGRIGEPSRELLGTDGIEAISPAILEHVNSSNGSIRDLALLALGLTGDASHAPFLVGVAANSKEIRGRLGRRPMDSRTRAAAVYALGALGATTHREPERSFIVHSLVELLPEIREDDDLLAAVSVSLGVAPIPLTAPRPAAKDAEPVEPTGRELAYIRLIEAYEHPKSDVLGKAQIPVALARLVMTANGPEGTDEDPAIAARRDELRGDLIKRLLGPLKGPKPLRNGSLREAHIQALGLLVNADRGPLDAGARAQLLKLAKDRHGREGGLAWLALARTATRCALPNDLVLVEVRGALGDAVVEGPLANRPWALMGLGILEHDGRRRGWPAAAGTLALVTSIHKKSSSNVERGAAAIALGLAGELSAERDLVKGLESGSFQLRGLRAIALALMDARGSMDVLRREAGAGVYRPYFLRELSTALALMGDPGLVNVLVNQLVGAAFMPERVAALSALAWAAQPEAAPTLLRVLQSKRLGRRRIDDTTRAFAAVAIGALCSREAAPWNTRFAQDVTWTAAPPSLTDVRNGGGLLDLF